MLHLGVQDPVMFSGSVRFNLDPFDTAGGDAVIWATLEQVGMAATIRDMPVRWLLLLADLLFKRMKTRWATLKHGGGCCGVCGTSAMDTKIADTTKILAIAFLGSHPHSAGMLQAACCLV